MSKEELEASLTQYNSQLALVTETLSTCDENERGSLLSLQNDLNQLIALTQESLDTINSQNTNKSSQPEIDDEYALFMQEMAKSGAYDTNNDVKEESSKQQNSGSEDSDIEEELSTLLGMKCAVYHTHKWGGEPSLHNAMVSSVVPRQDTDGFKDLQVQVLFTHPTHAEMLPCPFFLDGECRFDDEQCRYSHGTVVSLSSLKEASEPDFESVKVGSRVLVKLVPPDSQDISLKKKSSEKYHLWHRSIVRHVDLEKQRCRVTLEHGVRSGDKRKSALDEIGVSFENIYPLNNECMSSSDSEGSVSETEYPESKSVKSTDSERCLVSELSAQNNGAAIGDWEKHTRGIGSKLMLAMGYVAGSGLGAASDGRVLPVEARVVPHGKSLDHCMAITEKLATRDPLKVEQKLKRMQKKEEERQKRAYEREKEKEKRNVFNFLNRTIGDQSSSAETPSPTPSTNIRQSTNKDLNIEQFKITEETKRVERDIVRLQNSLSRHSDGSSGYKNVTLQIIEKHKELNTLKNKEQQITKEQTQRKNKAKMTVF